MTKYHMIAARGDGSVTPGRGAAITSPRGA